ncbi:hypothetical protein FKG94_00170 [Exilibacterium tricleocarpae]|uniref:Signal transduction histidine kinase internal region domain-containing protein n=1 Tax=Exilibacterium tricleocarpae TaxID=2591008 RepID=A0A545UBG2_9GAMM|nr:histidine kinase [Exilibacterium tricleocarpae]TQV86797.1 hypothetical protein FKG94_00170 [Exilibacterium tricleocarpae]
MLLSAAMLSLNVKRLAIMFGLWVGFGALHLMFVRFDYIRAAASNAAPLLTDLLHYLPTYASWSIICYFVYSLSEWLLLKKKLHYLTMTFIVGLVLWLPAFFYIDATIAYWLGIREHESMANVLATLSYQMIFFYTTIYILMCGFCLAASLYHYSKRILIEKLKAEKRAAEQQSYLSNLQVRALQSQLSPHFLFNSLGSISALARMDNREAVVTAIASLGDLLRFAVEANSRTTITLQEEIAFVRNYVALQALRFIDRFEFDITAPSFALSIPTPPFAIQLLVENAFLHSVSLDADFARIHVDIRAADALHVNINVINTPTIGGGSKKGLGSGLNNLKERLTVLYGEYASLTQRHTAQCHEVTLRLPMRGNND